MEINKYIYHEDEAKRLDRYVSENLSEYSRSFIQNIIEKDKVKVNNKVVKSSYKLKKGDEVTIENIEPEELTVEKENIDINIVYEDSDIIVVNKKQGMVVHPAPGVYTGTLVNALLYHCNDLSGINGKLRPGIVHRIDKDTSGVLVIAKNDNSHQKLSEQLKKHSMKREYIALVEGVIKEDEGTVDKALARDPKNRIKISVVEDGKNAITHYEVLERYEKYTLVKCILETGRTHQIRVHMNHIKHPLVGDPVYGFKKSKFNQNGQLLHAKVLGFIHPTTGEYMEFTADIPNYFNEILKKQGESY